MKSKITIAYLSIYFTLFACASQEKSEDQSVPKNTNEAKLLNVVFILADDLGQSQLGCYGGPYHTPNIDQLAKEGVKFTQAYASAAVCSPTRAALMTGKYPARLHLTDFIKGEAFPDSLLSQPNWQKFLPLEEITIAEVFKELNYQTAAIGKWHLSQEKRLPQSEKYNPDKQGFDEMVVTYKPNRDQTDPESDPHNVDRITQRAIQFLEAHQKEPFFLYISHNAIHDPVMEAQARIAKFAGDSRLIEKQIQPVLAAMVSRLDEGTGKVLRKLEELNLSENTLVVFYGDNGGKEDYASQYPYRKGKGWLYEGGIRVPLIIRWPGKVKPNSQHDLMVSSIDFYPTLIEAVGGVLPKQKSQRRDGRSFLKALMGTTELAQRPQYWHYPHYHRGSGMKPASAIRKGKYKLIEWHEALLSGSEEDAYELYDLEEDISEKNNLKDTLPGVLEALKQELNQWKNELGAQMPVLR